MSSLYVLSGHPRARYVDFQAQWLLGFTRVAGGFTEVRLAPMTLPDLSRSQGGPVSTGRLIPLVRCDVVNMTRHVHHHYDYNKDGHSRTYTMKVELNQTMTEWTLSALGGVDPSTAQSLQEQNNIRLTVAASRVPTGAGAGGSGSGNGSGSGSAQWAPPLHRDVEWLDLHPANHEASPLPSAPSSRHLLQISPPLPAAAVSESAAATAAAMGSLSAGHEAAQAGKRDELRDTVTQF